MLQAFPGADFIMHSHGWWSHVSADVTPADLERGAMPDGPVVEGGRCDELLSEYDNVYADVSAGSGWNALTRDREYTEEFLERHHEQVLFGTDKSCVEFSPPHFELFDRFSLSERAREHVAHRNLRRLLR